MHQPFQRLTKSRQRVKKIKVFLKKLVIFWKKLLFFFLKTIIFLRKLLLFLQNVFVFLEVHNFTLVRMSLYGRMRSLTHTYVKLHADVRVKACFPTWNEASPLYFTGNSQKGIEILKKKNHITLKTSTLPCT